MENHNIEHQELLTRLSQATAEIRFAKEQQWKTAYYAILLYSAIIALFLSVGADTPLLLKLVASAIVLLVTIVLVAIQLQQNNSLDEYRRGLGAIESLFQTGLADKLLRMSGISNTSSEEKRKQNRIYVISFTGVTIVGSLACLVVILRKELKNVIGAPLMTVDLSTFNWQSVSAIITLAAVLVALFLPLGLDRKRLRDAAKRIRKSSLVYLGILRNDLEEMQQTRTEPNAMAFGTKNQAIVNALEAQFLSAAGLRQDEYQTFANLLIALRRNVYMVSATDERLLNELLNLIRQLHTLFSTRQ